ncbi:hypothetical protein [Aquamicrobium sp. LC103]|uniref:hypothetical protein n=1 Tax=Aquamicrobium sp. LC103 TaxID=1120658 RepID=UPI001FEF444E|nr:hypothetical protein [Aquamicrobium sp. LC103]
MVSYRMAIGGELMSVSLATILLSPTQGGMLLTYTEQAAFFDGAPDGVKNREEGWRELFERLAAELETA